MRKTFWFDGESAAAHGLAASGSGTFNAAERDVETVAIPGRNGDLIIDNGRYKNISVAYPVSICSDFAANAERCRAWLGSKTGYHRLEDDWDPDHYRLGRFQGPLEFSPGFLNRTAEGTVTFDCKPQRFLKTGEFPMTVTEGMTLVNPTRFAAKPLIRVEGSGTVLLYLNKDYIGIAVQFPDWTNHVYFDCEALDAYYVKESGARGDANSCVSITGTNKGLPELRPGASEIIMITSLGEISQVQITPRWWTL